MGWSLIDDYDTRYFSDYDLGQLAVDQFYLYFNTSNFEKFFIYTLNKNCIECPYVLHCVDSKCSWNPGSKGVFATNSKFRITNIEGDQYWPQDQKDEVICDVDENFGQFGIYSVNINKTQCGIQVLKEPVHIYTPIITVILIYLALYLCVFGLCYAWKKLKNFKSKEGKEDKAPKKERIQSLDTFRGIAIVLMIFVNYGGGSYEVLNHTIWNGLHLADLLFPWFIWIMGVCVPISLYSSFKKNVPNKELVTKILIRSIKLFAIGIFLGSGSDLDYLRIFGVLQRFSVSYLVCGVICVYLFNRSLERTENKILREFDDVEKTFKGWIVVLTILIVYLLLIFLVAAPDCPTGYMGPGGLHKNASYSKCTGGATGYIDSLILGDHRYQKPTIFAVYATRAFDPEGIVGCLPTILHAFIGIQAGIILLVYKQHFERIIRWIGWGVVTGLIGGGLCEFSKENGIIPINKNLWSLSFVLVTSSFAFILLAFCYIIIDVRKFWSGKPFLFAGMNAILMYIGHEMTDNHFPIRWYLHNDIVPDNQRRTHFLALMSDVWGTGMWVLIAYYLFKIKYFFSV